MKAPVKVTPRRPRRPAGISDAEWLKARPKEFTVREWLRLGDEQVKANRERAMALLSQPVQEWKPMSYAFDRDQIKDAMRGFPGVPQVEVPRYEPAASTDLDHVESLFRSPKNRDLILRQIERGQKLGGGTYYPSYYPLKVALDQEFGPGTFSNFNALSTGASSQNPVMMENAIASVLAKVQRTDGVLDPSLAADYNRRYLQESGDTNRLFMGGAHVRNANEFLTAKSPGSDITKRKQKQGGYYWNKEGNLRPGVIDTHEADGMTIGSEYNEYFRNLAGVSDTEYAAFERGYQAMADKAGVPMGSAQAGRWQGGRDITGVKTPPGDALDTLEKQAAYTLVRRGEKVTPESVRRYILNALSGNGPPLMPWWPKSPMPDYRKQGGKADIGVLAGIGGATAAAGALYSSDAEAGRFNSVLLEVLGRLPENQSWTGEELAERAKKGWPTFGAVPLPLMQNPMVDPSARLGERDRSFDLTEEDLRREIFAKGPAGRSAEAELAAALAGDAAAMGAPMGGLTPEGMYESGAGYLAELTTFIPDLLTGLAEEGAFAGRNREALDAYLAGTGEVPFAPREDVPELPNLWEEMLGGMGVAPDSPLAFAGALASPATPLALAKPVVGAARALRRGGPGALSYLRNTPHPGMTPGEFVATSEYVPGYATGHMVDDTGKAMADQPEGFRQRYTMLQQPNVGQADPFYSALGYGQKPWEKGMGRYENTAGKVEKNPLIVTRVEGEPGKMTAKEREDTSIAERARGLLTAQEASAGHKLTPVGPMQANAASIQTSLPGYADPAYVEQVRGTAEGAGVPWVDRGDGRFTFPGAFSETPTPMRAFKDAWTGALTSDAYRQVSARPALFESTYEGLPWSPRTEQGTGAATQTLVDAIEKSSNPERFWQMLESPSVRQAAGTWARNDDVLASSLPLLPRDDLQRLRRLVDTGTLRQYVAKFGTKGLPALAGLGLGLGALRDEQPETAL